MGGHSSYRVARNLPVLGRGLVIAEEGVVPDYARVRRVFHLTNAITKYYYSPFYLEAQVPGYHARVAWLGGRQVGFTRDGRYCAFTTDRAPDFIPDSFFQEGPGRVVCLAIEGNGIPYATPSCGGIADDIRAWGTEILEQREREPMAAVEKYELFDKHGIKSAERIGPFDADDIDKIAAWMKEFEAAGGLGIVIKPSESHHRPLKYSLPSALLRGAPGRLGLDGEVREDPHFERLLQGACAATETNLHAGDWDWATVGESLFSSLAQAAQTIAEGGTLTESYSVWVHEKESATTLLEQLEERTEGTSIHELELIAENDGWRLRFERRLTEASAAVERRLSGASYRD
jgi:putative ATP-dependent DNA ligase